MSKRIKFVLLLLFSLFLFSSRSVFSQGNCSCQPKSHGSSSVVCSVISNNCDAGYQPSCPTDLRSCGPNTCSCIPIASGSGGNSNITSQDVFCNPHTGGARTGINTALGCIPYDNINALVASFLKFGVAIGGVIALFLLSYAGFLISTSQVDPNRLKAGQELITAVISGIIMMIFSIFILKIVGVDILGLDKFGF